MHVNSGVTRLTLVVTAVSVVASRPAALQTLLPSDAASLLAQVASYLDTYEQRFGAVVAEETYAQTATPPSFTGGESQHRKLTSDLMLLDLAGDWVEFRDVYAVDGSKVRDHDARLRALLTSPAADSLSQAQHIADESASYNLGAARNINVPTMALAFLTRRAQSRSTFSIEGAAELPTGRARIVTFTETVTPSLIRAHTTNVASHGRAWVDPGTGAVLRTELNCSVPKPWAVAGTITVSYALERSLNLYVPIRMDEQYTVDTGEVDRGTATYSHFHTFNVDTKTFVGRGRGGLY